MGLKDRTRIERIVRGRHPLRRTRAPTASRQERTGEIDHKRSFRCKDPDGGDFATPTRQGDQHLHDPRLDDPWLALNHQLPRRRPRVVTAERERRLARQIDHPRGFIGASSASRRGAVLSERAG
jgi:hypothetical protein